MGGGRDGAGRSGRARLATHLAAAVSRSTLLRLVRARPDPAVGQVRALGVDDFAWRRVHSYGTVLVDLEARRVVDLLDERSADALAAWLDAHPGVEVVCRDRAACYAVGAARGGPTATNVADRWHLWHNLCQTVERAVGRLRPQWRAPSPEPVPAPGVKPPAPLPEPVGGLAARTRARHAEIHALVVTGLPLSHVAEQLRLNRRTVRRFARAATPEELLGAGPALLHHCDASQGRSPRVRGRLWAMHLRGPDDRKIPARAGTICRSVTG